MPWETLILILMTVTGVVIIIGAIVEDLTAVREPFPPPSYPHIKRDAQASNVSELHTRRVGRHRAGHVVPITYVPEQFSDPTAKRAA